MGNSFRLRLPLLVGAVGGAVSLVVGLLPATGSAQLALPASTDTTVVAVHSGQVLDVAEISHEPGAPVIQWPWNGGPNQRWIFDALDDGMYRIVVAHSGQVLDVANISYEPGAPVIQWPWNGGPNQRWRVEDVPGQGSRIVAVHSGQVLDVANISHEPGAPVIQWPWNGGPNQRWRVEDQGDRPVTLTQSCLHRERGVTVTVRYPEGWHANDPSVQPCSAFDPEPFSVDPGTEFPRHLAVVLLVEPRGFDDASAPTGLRVERERRLTIDRQAAVRQEVVTTGEGLGPAGQEATRYVIDGGPNRSIIASTYNVEGNDYARSVEVLDAMADALAIEPRGDDDGRLDADDVLMRDIDAEPEVGEASRPMVSVTDVRLGRHNGFDRIVFEIGGEGQAGWDVRYVDEARAAGSGFPIDVDGEAILRVRLDNIALPPDAPAGVEPWDGPERLRLEGAGPVAEVIEDKVYEGVQTFFVGVTDATPFQVNRLQSPQRVVVDVAAS